MHAITIDFKRQEIYEAGAVLVTILAHPNGSEETRGALQQSLCAEALKDWAGRDPRWASEPQWIKPIYAFREEKQIKRDLRTLGRRIRDRMVAARMAIAFLQEATGQLPKLPPGIKRLSVNQMAELVLRDARQSDPENVKSRVWRPSLPVIHLAAATAVFLNVSAKAGEGATSVGDLLTNRSYIEWIVRTAQLYEHMLAKSRLRINPAKLVRVRFAGG